MSEVSEFDKTIGGFDGLPDVSRTKPSVIRAVPMLGVGPSSMYVVQTIRQKERGDFIFLECVSEKGTVRLVIPPKVAQAISRQRDSLTKKGRSAASRQSMEDRMARGEQPWFLKVAK